MSPQILPLLLAIGGCLMGQSARVRLAFDEMQEDEQAKEEARIKMRTNLNKDARVARSSTASTSEVRSVAHEARENASNPDEDREAEQIEDLLDPSPSGNAPVVAPQTPELSRKWMEHLEARDVKELRERVGEELYDAECSDYITEIINSHAGPHSWWLKTFEKDPLVGKLIDKKTAKDIEGKWQGLSDQSLQAAPGLQTRSMGWFRTLIHHTFGRMSRGWKSWRARRSRSTSKEAKRFQEELDKIRNGEKDDNGREATVCSLDYSTLKLMPWSREFHKDLELEDKKLHGQKPKCAPIGAPDENSRRQLGYMDVDRVIRGTQMAIYQTCYFKCLRFVVRNFEKTAMGENTEGTAFCELPYEQQKTKVGNVDTFLFKLVSDKESDRYEECQMLFSEDDSGSEMIDFAIEEVCSVYRRPTPMYFPSESPPLELYQQRTSFNQPVCRPAGLNASEQHAVQVGPTGHGRSEKEPQRYCTEGTHCVCQRASRVAHVAAPGKTPKKWKALHMDAWFSQDHASALRPAGKSAFVWIDPAKVMGGKWGKQMRDFRVTNYGNHIGIGLLVSSSVMFAVGMGWFSAIGLWFTTVAGPWFTTVAAPWFAGVGTAIGGGAATAASSFATAGIGPAIVLGLVGLTFVVRSNSFDCSAKIGCYPLTCKYNHDTKSCGMTLDGVRSDEGPTNAAWWVPPPSMGCTLKSRKWWKFYGASRSCHLKACTPEQTAKSLVGYFISPHSKQGKKFDFLNCQPLNIKDMSGAQQSEFLKTLNDDARVEVGGRIRHNQKLKEHLFSVHKIKMPECLSDANCQEGLAGHPEELPYCHPDKKVCRKPIISTLELEIDGTDEANWKEELKKFFAVAMFKRSDLASELVIIEEPVDESAQAPNLQQRPEGELPEGSEIEDDGVEHEDLSDPVVEQPDALLEENAAAQPVGKTKKSKEEDDRSSVQSTAHNRSVANRSSLQNSTATRSVASLAQRHESWKVKISSGAPTKFTKKFKLVVKARKNSGRLAADEARIMKVLKKMEQKDAATTSEDLSITSLLGDDFAVKIHDIGTVCEKRAPVDHSKETCGSTRSGSGCPLTCEEGWVPHSSIKCELDGTWSDEKIEQGSLNPDETIIPVYKCEQVTCPPLAFEPSFCPRTVPGCYEMDSACERGGLSGEQPFCEIKPTEGYYLVEPHNKKFKCGTDKKWTHGGTFSEDPQIGEWTCKGAVAESAGLVDRDSGVESICDEEKSGKKDQDDTVPGKCKVVCKQGYMQAKTDPLRCSTDNKWIGRAKCEPISCAVEEIPAEAFDRNSVQVTCPQPLGAGDKAEDKCQLECSEAGHVLTASSLYCNHEGKWAETVTCGLKTAAMGGPKKDNHAASPYRLALPGTIVGVTTLAMVAV